MKPKKQKVFLFGIDGFVPKLVFGRYRNQLPNFSCLIEEGSYGILNSTVPPTSTVAWTSINSGRDPGETGIQSYMAKQGRHYRTPSLVTSTDIKTPLLWDMLSRKGKKTIALNIPLTYPAKKINGVMVTDFLTPSFDDKSVYPVSFKKKIQELLFGKDYMFDVAGFLGYKKMNLDFLISQSYKMTKQHFKIARYLFEKMDWDLFDFVTIGTDRLHHMFWAHIDPTHERYVKNSPYKNAVLDFYKYVDGEFGKFMKHSKMDSGTTVMVVSDHGMDHMIRRINLNDWLREKGFLAVKKEFADFYANGPKRLDYETIDWDKTSVIATEGYQANVYIYDKKNRVKILRRISKELPLIRGVKGEKLNTKVYDTSKIYRKKGDKAPDAVVYFDNLRYGTNNDIGNKGLYSEGTTVGTDDAGHAPEGVIILKKEGGPLGNLGQVETVQIAPTILKALGIKEYKKLSGKPLI
ncbi:MAG: alkaline phosphatase family protein [Candidatus Liptonbacteria bacterium]|nr:alkaline phosphatase family protein [Candidatus Liptonbacteria bacterium]